MKNSNKIALIFKGMDWFFLAYLVTMFFVPQVIASADLFFKTFYGCVYCFV